MKRFHVHVSVDDLDATSSLDLAINNRVCCL